MSLLVPGGILRHMILDNLKATVKKGDRLLPKINLKVRSFGEHSLHDEGDLSKTKRPMTILPLIHEAERITALEDTDCIFTERAPSTNRFLDRSVRPLSMVTSGWLLGC